MIALCVLGVALFYSLFFYTVMKYQHVENIQAA
jgi:hypothetical protein